MKKEYLGPGDALSVYILGKVGPSGTIGDIQVDVTATAKSSGDPQEWGSGGAIGSIVRDGNTADIFLEAETGKLWYDDHAWH